MCVYVCCDEDQAAGWYGVGVGGLGGTDGGKGVMQLWALPARRPSGKELFMASTQGQPFEKKSWEGSRKEAASLYAASLQQLKTVFL